MTVIKKLTTPELVDAVNYWFQTCHPEETHGVITITFRAKRVNMVTGKLVGLNAVIQRKPELQKDEDSNNP